MRNSTKFILTVGALGLAMAGGWLFLTHQPSGPFAAEKLPPRTCTRQADSVLVTKQADLEFHFGKDEQKLARLKRRFQRNQDRWRASPTTTSRALLEQFFCITNASYTELERGDISNETHAVVEARIGDRFFELELVRPATADSAPWLLNDVYWVDKSNFAPFPRPEIEKVEAAARFNAFQWSAFNADREIVFKKEPVCIVTPAPVKIGKAAPPEEKILGPVSATITRFFTDEEALPRAVQYRLNREGLSAVYTLFASDKYSDRAQFSSREQFQTCQAAAEEAFSRFAAVKPPASDQQ